MERLLPWLRRSGWVYAVLAVALAVLAWRVAAGGGDPPAEARVPIAAGTTSSGAPVPAEPEVVLVHVAGAVRRPGVYELGSGGRVRDALRRAGGPTRAAELSGINLAAPLADGQQVVVPGRSAAGAAPAAGPAAGPVSLSAATPEQLEELDGIGPSLAAAIVAYRQEIGGFSSVDQLDEVPGIGPARLEALRAKVVP